MMAAVYKGSRTIEVERVEVPRMGPADVLLEVSHCGICGSDLHTLMEDWGTPDSIAGHEYSGVVVAVGSDAGDWSVGDRAVGGPGPGCGHCPSCLAGATNLCTSKAKSGIDPFVGAFAEYKVVATDSLYRIPESLDLRTAALTEPVAVALRGVTRSGAGERTRALVTGGGPIGLLTVAVLRAIGVSDITVSEPAAPRRGLAARVGATEVIEPEELTTPPLPMDLADRPFGVAFECSGRPDAMEKALDNLDRSGTLLLSGTGMKRPRFDTNRIILNELNITGTVEYTGDDYRRAIDLLAEGHLPTDILIEAEDRPLIGVQLALEMLVRGELAGKVMVDPHA